MTGLFLGVGIGAYSDAKLIDLPAVVGEVELVSELVGEHFTANVLHDAGKSEIEAWLGNYRGHFAFGEGALVLMWSGHGRTGAEAEQLRLLASDSADSSTGGLIASEIAGMAAETGASQILLIVDTCYAGRALKLVHTVFNYFDLHPPAGQVTWCGVLAACHGEETVRRGPMAAALQRLLREGPQLGNSDGDQDMRRLWSVRRKQIDGDLLCATLIKEMERLGAPQIPKRASVGVPREIIQNPLWRPAAGSAMVSDVLADVVQDLDFHGRDHEVSAVSQWLRSAGVGTFVVTGAPGAGKSALLNQVLRCAGLKILGREDDTASGEAAVRLDVRGLNVEAIAEAIDHILTGTGVLEDAGTVRNVFELCGAIRRRADIGAGVPVLVLDSFEQAVGVDAVVEDLVRSLAKVTKLLVGTRPMPVGISERSRLEISGLLLSAHGGLGPVPVEATLASPEQILDLNDLRWRESGWHALATWLRDALNEVPDGATISDEVFSSLRREAGEDDQPSFLLAGLLIDHIRAGAAQGRRLGRPFAASSVGAALDSWIEQESDSLHNDEIHALLDALSTGLGAGLPEREWLLLANATREQPDLGRTEIARTLATMGRYILEDSESGEAVYRFAHELITQHFAYRSWDETGQSQFFRASALVAAAAELNPTANIVGSPHLKRYLSSYVAAAGARGLDLFRQKPIFASDFVAAAVLVSGYYARQGALDAAALVAHEAVLATGIPDLLVEDSLAASACAQLAGVYRDQGQVSGAIKLQEQAVTLLENEDLARPEAVETLAAAMNNLASMRADAFDPEAVPAAQRAVGLWRQLVARGVGGVNKLGAALNSLSVAYSVSGQSQEALQASKEAVEILRTVRTDHDRAALARALQNLGNRLAEIGFGEEAVQASEEACRLWQELAKRDQIWRAEWQGARSALAVCYVAAGRTSDARVVAEDLLRSYEGLSAPTLTQSVEHARVSVNYAHMLLEDGIAGDAIEPAKDAVTIMEKVVAADGAYKLSLALVLNTYANAMARLGHASEALQATERALSYYRYAREGNPGLDARTAGVLLNHASHLADVHRLADAIAAAEEAVAIVSPYREDETDKYVIAIDGLARIAVYLTQLGDLQGAAQHARRAVLEGEYLLSLQAIDDEKLGDICDKAAVAVHYDLDQTTEYLKRAEELLPAVGSPQQVRRYVNVVRNLAATQGLAGQTQAGLARAKKALSICEGFAEADWYRAELARTQAVYARLLRVAARCREASEFALAAAGNFLLVPELTFQQVIDCARVLATLASAITEQPENLKMLDQEIERALDHTQPLWHPAFYHHLIVGVPPRHTRVPSWVYQVLQSLHGQPLLAAIDFRGYVRVVRGADPARFDTLWKEHTGDADLPSWMRLEPQQIALAGEWASSASYAQAQEFLRRRPFMGGQAYDAAVEESVVRVVIQGNPARAMALSLIWQSRTLAPAENILGRNFDFAEQFLNGKLPDRMRMLHEDGAQLSTPHVIAYLFARGAPTSPPAIGLLVFHQVNLHHELARAGTDGSSADEFLASIASDYAIDALRHACSVLYEHAQCSALPDVEDSAAFFLAVCGLLSGPESEAGQGMMQILQKSPYRRPGWQQLLTRIASRRPEYCAATQLLTGADG